MTSSTGQFLLELFAYQDMRHSPLQATPPLAFSHALRAKPLSAVLGFAPELFEILGKLLYIGKSCSWDFSTEPKCEAEIILERLYEWELPMTLVGSKDGALADAMRMASVLSLQELIGAGSNKSKWPKEYIVGRLILQIMSIPPSDSAATGLVWPWLLFVAGSHTDSNSSSAREIMTRFDLQKDSLPGRDCMRQLLEARWQHGADCKPPSLLKMLLSI
jgi:hypothetical protein